MRQDYLIDKNYDLLIQGGDLVVGQSDQNHKAVILMANKGQIRQYVRIGVNINQEINGILNQNTKRLILESFKQDGYGIQGISFSGGGINIP
jgi:hypothetical protein